MADVVDRATRSRMMAGIRGAGTQPERTIRSGLFRRGFRYRLHLRGLPGRPDIVLRKYRAVIFVHGCFWHRHGCPLFKMPTTRTGFWVAKIEGNHERDRRQQAALIQAGWRVMIVWECALKGSGRLPLEEVLAKIENWLQSGTGMNEIAGVYASSERR